LVGINQLIDDEDEKSTDAPPVTAEAFSRQFIRIFRKTDEVPNDQLQKTLRGTGMSPADFEKRGWCEKDGKVFRMVEPLAWARAWKGQNRRGMARDLDQTLFLIGASYTDICFCLRPFPVGRVWHRARRDSFPTNFGPRAGG
jgi:hypothetical protein